MIFDLGYVKSIYFVTHKLVIGSSILLLNVRVENFKIAICLEVFINTDALKILETTIKTLVNTA